MASESTSSLPSHVGTIASTTPLIQKPPSKDYASALAILQSRYGNEGQVPSPKPTPSQKLPESSAATASSRSWSEGTKTESMSTSLMKKVAQSLRKKEP